MENIILTIHLIIALVLITAVLLQRSEGGGLGTGGGSGNSGLMSGRSAATAMTKLTWIIAIFFLTTSIILTILAAKKSGPASVLDSNAISTNEKELSVPLPDLDSLEEFSSDSGPTMPPTN